MCHGTSYYTTLATFSTHHARSDIVVELSSLLVDKACRVSHVLC